MLGFLLVGSLLLLHRATCLPVQPPSPTSWITPTFDFDYEECLEILNEAPDGYPSPNAGYSNLFATAPNSAIFWSTDITGADPNDNKIAAQRWALAAGGGKTTLNQTPGGARLEEYVRTNPNLPAVVTGLLWNCASLVFAHLASGTIHAFSRKMRLISPEPDPPSPYWNGRPTFFNIELVEILNNNEDAQIVYHYNLNNGWDVYCGPDSHCTGCTTDTVDTHTELAIATYVEYNNNWPTPKAYPDYGNPQDEFNTIAC